MSQPMFPDMLDNSEFKKVQDQVIKIVEEQMGCLHDSLKPETLLVHDLGADSLDAVEMIMEFEDHFDIHIPDCDESEFASATINSVAVYIWKRVR